MSEVRISPGKQEEDVPDTPVVPIIPDLQNNNNNDQFVPIKADPAENTYRSLLFKVKKTQIEMIYGRGYNTIEDKDKIDEMNILKMSNTQFVDFYDKKRRDKNITFKAALYMKYFRYMDTAHTIIDELDVYYPESTESSSQTSKSQMEPVFNRIKDKPNANVCIITEHPVSNNVSESFINKFPSVIFQFFTYIEMGYNPTKHSYVPRHELIYDKSEINRITYDIKENLTVKRNDKIYTRLSKMPIISSFDPISRYLGARQGDIIKIYRENIGFDSMVSEYIIYRYVWNTPLENKRKGS